jgi:hypothetical protein
MSSEYVSGQFTFPGIQGVLSASMTITNGIAPSVMQVSVPYEDRLLTEVPRVGVANWYYGGQLIRSFPYSAVGDVNVSRAEGVVWNLSILDRRWMWKGYVISGEYNVKISDKLAVVREFPRTPRQLATLCLQAMGEVGFNVLALPGDDYPYVKWEVENPANALASICEMYGCEVSLQMDNTVKIVRRGEGRAIPYQLGLSKQLSIDHVFDPAEYPQKIVCFSAPVEWDADLPLMPVGVEIDDTIKKPEELSYIIASGKTWYEMQPEFTDIPDKRARKLAVENLGRLWRVDAEKLKQWQIEAGRVYLDGGLVPVEDVRQLLPLIPRQVQTILVDGEVKNAEPYVWGYFFRDNARFGITKEFTEQDIEDMEDLGKIPVDFRQLVYTGSIQIDAEKGTVKFDEPVYAWDAGVGDATENIEQRSIESARLFLKCTVNLYHKETREVQRYYREMSIDPSSPLTAMYEVRDDVSMFRYKKKKETTEEETGKKMVEWVWEDNAPKASDKLDFYLFQMAQAYQSFPAATANFTGFIPMGTDGAIRQVGYSIDASGAATSTVEYNREDSLKTLTFDEMRHRQKTAVYRKRNELLAQSKSPDPKQLAALNKEYRRFDD